MAKKLNEYQINNGTQVGIKGVVSYSHIATKLEGKALELANQNTKFPSAEGYFTMSIEVTADPAMKALHITDVQDNSQVELAKYCYDHIYASKKAENTGKKFFRANSKAPTPPRVFKKDVEGKLQEIKLNGNELAAGTNVELIMNYFTTKFNPGVGLNAVIIEDAEIKLFTPSAPAIKGYEMSSAPAIEMDRAQAAPAAPSATDVATNAVGDEDPVQEEAFTPIADTTDKPDEDASFAASLAKFMS